MGLVEEGILTAICTCLFIGTWSCRFQLEIGTRSTTLGVYDIVMSILTLLSMIYTSMLIYHAFVTPSPDGEFDLITLARHVMEAGNGISSVLLFHSS
jgi:hypothetical protein